MHEISKHLNLTVTMKLLLTSKHDIIGNIVVGLSMTTVVEDALHCGM